MRGAWIVALGGCIACGGSCTNHSTSQPSPETAADSVANTANVVIEALAAPNAGELLVGRWRMIAEAPAEPDKPIYEQKRRLLSLGADSQFTAENFYESWAGAWQLDGTTLTLGELTTQLVEVDEDRLVLIEDVPEVYLFGGPPQKARITYRRVSERELGPMLGRELEISAPRAGSYAAAYAYRMGKFPTMEISISESIDGRATLVLAADGTASGCFGVAHASHSSISKYASDDGRNHSERSDDRRLRGWRGRWTTTAEHTTVEAERSWQGSCDERGDDQHAEFAGPGLLELDCVAIAANDALPVDALACRIVTAQYGIDPLALNPADTERAGPYTLQSDPMGHISTDRGRPWLMFGAAPGLTVESEDGRDTLTPVVSFTAGPVDFVERNFVARESDGR